jgi:hypothetical protein
VIGAFFAVRCGDARDLYFSQKSRFRAAPRACCPNRSRMCRRYSDSKTEYREYRDKRPFVHAIVQFRDWYPRAEWIKGAHGWSRVRRRSPSTMRGTPRRPARQSACSDHPNKNRHTFRIIMSTMKAIRFHGNQDLRLDEVPVAPVGADQVKIAPEWCGLCGSGWNESPTIAECYNRSTRVPRGSALFPSWTTSNHKGRSPADLWP